MATHSITSSASASSLAGTFESERLRCLEVDDKLEPSRPLNRQVGWIFPLEDATSIDADLTKDVILARSITHRRRLRQIRGRNRSPESGGTSPPSQAARNGWKTRGQQECIRGLLCQGRKSPVDVEIGDGI